MNELSKIVTLLNKQISELTSKDFQDTPLDVVVAEPFYSSSLLPWHNLHYWYSLCKLRQLMKTDCTIVPGVVELKAIAGILSCQFPERCFVKCVICH